MDVYSVMLIFTDADDLIHARLIILTPPSWAVKCETTPKLNNCSPPPAPNFNVSKTLSAECRNPNKEISREH